MTAAFDYDEAGGEAGWSIDVLQRRVAKLEDLLRWRDAEKEKPTRTGAYLIANGHTCLVAVYGATIGWSDYLKVTHWRPIGPLPGEGGE